jgi:hypothetical protein
MRAASVLRSTPFKVVMARKGVRDSVMKTTKRSALTAVVLLSMLVPFSSANAQELSAVPLGRFFINTYDGPQFRRYHHMTASGLYSVTQYWYAAAPYGAGSYA